MGEILTFYSYKGGTGRSMALANIAHILAWPTDKAKSDKPKNKVLMIDWDLEAPGLHKYFIEQLKKNFSLTLGQSYPDALNQKPGLIDFLEGVHRFYREAYPSGMLESNKAETAEAVAAFAAALKANPLDGFILSVTAPSEVSPESGVSGLFLMKAGNQAPVVESRREESTPEQPADYIARVRKFDWVNLFDKYGSFFTLFREYLESEYAFVLIDSRTGLTDIGDICTRVMPQKLVAVFVPNEQNIEGTLDIVKAAAEFRSSSRDPRDLVVYPLASRIDATASRLRKIWWEGGPIDDRTVIGYEPQFETLFSTLYQIKNLDLREFFDSTQVPYDSDYAFGERVAARDRAFDKLSIGRACQNLTRYIVEDCAPWDALPTKSLAAEADPTAAPDNALLPLLQRLVLPAWIAALGIALAVFVGLQDYDLNIPRTAEARVSESILIENLPEAMPGFGAGVARPLVSWLASSPPVPPAPTAAVPPPRKLLLEMTRGSISPVDIQIPAGPGGLELVRIRSAGFGKAELAVYGTATKNFPIYFYIPWSLIAAAIGGIFCAFAFRLWDILGSSFGRPSYSTLGVFAAFDVLVILFFQGVFLLLVAPYLTFSYNFFLVATFLISALGHLSF